MPNFSEMNDDTRAFAYLLRRAGQPRVHIHRVLTVQPINVCALYHLYERAVEYCCVRENSEVLKDISVFVDSIGSSLRVNLTAQPITLLSPLRMILGLTGTLSHRGQLKLLPTYVHRILAADATDVDEADDRSAVIYLMSQIVMLTEGDEVSAVRGYGQLLRTVELLQTIRRSTDEFYYIELFSVIKQAFISTENASKSSVQMTGTYFQFIVRLVKLLMEHGGAPGNKFYTIYVLAAAKTQLDLFSKMEDKTESVSLVNAVMEGIADVFRCFLIVEEYASKASLGLETIVCDQAMIKRLIALVDFSSEPGHSTRLIEMVWDSMDARQLIVFKQKLSDQIRKVPEGCEGRPSLIRTLEWLDRIETPSGLQHLARQAILRTLWKSMDSKAVIHRGLWDRDLSGSGLPKTIEKYCCFY